MSFGFSFHACANCLVMIPNPGRPYESKTGKLIQYEGKSNIRSSDGDLLDVVIKYDYGNSNLVYSKDLKKQKSGG